MEIDLEPNRGGVVLQYLLNLSSLGEAGWKNDDGIVCILYDRIFFAPLRRDRVFDEVKIKGLINSRL